MDETAGEAAVRTESGEPYETGTEVEPAEADEEGAAGAGAGAGAGDAAPGPERCAAEAG